MSEKKEKKNKKERRGRPRKHGGFVYLQTGEIPERMTHIRQYISDIREGLILDIAGAENHLTTAQRVLIDRTIILIGVCRCIEEWVKNTGVFVNGKMEPSLSEKYIAFQNSIRLNLDKLGIDKREKDEPMDLQEYIRLKDAENEKQGESQGKKDKS
jgi:hypothetical protein